VNKGMVYNRRRLLTSVMSTTMVTVTTTMRLLWAALPPIRCGQNKSRLLATDLSEHRRRLYPFAIKRRRIVTLICPGERFLHGGKVCVSSVSYLLALCSMAGARSRASMLCSQKAREMLYRASA